ncbi:hypothetical protein Landi51_08215 [Colletotrichum acutatum]
MFDWRRSHHLWVRLCPCQDVVEKLLYAFVIVAVAVAAADASRNPMLPYLVRISRPWAGLSLRLASFVFPGSGFIPRASRASDSVAAFLLFCRQPTASFLAIFPAHVSPVPQSGRGSIWLADKHTKRASTGPLSIAFEFENGVRLSCSCALRCVARSPLPSGLQYAIDRASIPVSRSSCTHASVQHGPSAMVLVAQHWAEMSQMQQRFSAEWESSVQMHKQMQCDSRLFLEVAPAGQSGGSTWSA